MRFEGTPRIRAAVLVALLACAALMFGGASASATPSNLITNGSFETGYPGNSHCGAGQWYPVGYVAGCTATIPGWTAGNGVDWHADGSLGLPAEDGNLAVDLDSDGSHLPGTLTQSVDTTAGAPYELTYWYSANWQCNQGQRNGQVSVAGLTQEFSVNTAGGSQPWFEETLDFVATDSSTAITFASLSAGNCGPAIDDVQLYQSGPSGGAKTVPAYASQGPSAGYNPTGVTLAAGQQVTITADGTWDVCGGNCPSDANGVPTKHNNYLDPSAPAGELVGSLDGGATWFAIGTGPTTVAGPGTLILAANDYSTNFGDNSGRLSVSITAVETPDSTPPTIVASATTAPNANGWYSGDVTVQFTCSDDGSGIPAGACPADQVLTGEGAAISSLAETVTDAAGNTSEPSNVVTVSIDRTAPTIVATATTSPNANGWYTGDVTVHFTCSDDGSGIPAGACPADQVLSGDGAGVSSLSESVTDAAGNTSNPSNVVSVNIDGTAPSIVASATTSPNANGWYSGDVTVHFTCSDSGSGIPAGACPADQVLTGEGASLSSLSGSVTDAAGNVSAASNVVTVSIDRTAPTVTYSPDGQTYDVNDTVSITCNATDDLSGVASSTCADVSAPAWSLGLGTHPLSATATDKAGNVGSGSGSYTVRATANGVCALVQAWESKSGVATSLCAKLTAAAASRARGSDTAADNQLAAFRNELSAQSGKSISAAHVATLDQLSHAL